VQTRSVKDMSDAALALSKSDHLVTGTSLSALLPLKVSGRHYADNLRRLDVLFSSLLHFGAEQWLDELLVVVRADEAQAIGGYLASWSDLPITQVIEEEYFSDFGRFTRPWQVRPWQRQQIIKLNASAITTAPFVLMLDPDVIAVKPVEYDLLVPKGRALLEPEARVVHRQWWLDSADLLGTQPNVGRQGMNVTPAILSTAILEQVHRRLEQVNGRSWMEVLLTSYCDWTEYTLYLLAAETAGLLDQYHEWAGSQHAPTHLQVAPMVSVWDAQRATRETVERLFTGADPGLFAVVQGARKTGVPASDVADVVANHLPVRGVAVDVVLPGPTRGSKLKERFSVASRRAAWRVHRTRRSLSRRGRLKSA
jgi:Family of unknown function (DUF6492)